MLPLFCLCEQNFLTLELVLKDVAWPLQNSFSAEAPLVEAGVPSVQFYLGRVFFLETLACGAGGWFSPGHAAVAVADLQLQGRISTWD